jgi:hypothetical protein
MTVYIFHMVHRYSAHSNYQCNRSKQNNQTNITDIVHWMNLYKDQSLNKNKKTSLNVGEFRNILPLCL